MPPNLVTKSIMQKVLVLRAYLISFHLLFLESPAAWGSTQGMNKLKVTLKIKNERTNPKTNMRRRDKTKLKEIIHN